MVVHLGLDGSRFNLDGALPLDGGPTSTADIVTGPGLYQLHSGPVSLGSDLANAAGVGEFSEEFDFAGATLRVGRRKIYDERAHLADDLTIASWVGSNYSVTTHMYNGSTEKVVGVLRTLRIRETGEGVSAVPTAGGGTSFRAPPAVLKPVLGLGLLEIRTMTQQLARDLPSWEGVPVAGGELFRDVLPGGGTYFVLATRAVRVTILPLADTIIDAIPQLLGQLRIGRLR